MRATLAVARSEMDLRFALNAGFAFCVAFGFTLLSPVPRTSPLFQGWEGLAIAILTTDIVDLSLASRIGDLAYFALPLYGRQLARAHAVPSLVCAIAPPLGFVAGSALAGIAQPADFLPVATMAVGVQNLARLSATFRRGPSAWLFRTLGWTGAIVVGALGMQRVPFAWLLATVAAVAFGFVALRQLGETIARYDPTG